MVGLVFTGALSGTVAVESVFAIQGLGTAAVQATANRDLPVIQGVVIYFTLIVIAANLRRSISPTATSIPGAVRS